MQTVYVSEKWYAIKGKCMCIYNEQLTERIIVALVAYCTQAVVCTQ